MFKIKINPYWEGSVEKLFEHLKKSVMNEVEIEFKNKIGPAIVDRIMGVFDQMAEEIGLEDDPTSPQFWRDEFREKLLSESRRVNKTANGISISLGDKNYLGYNDDIQPDDTEPLKWAVFWFEGLAGSYAFITPELLAQVRGSSALDRTRMGRFGEGFLISRDDYEGSGFESVAPFSEVEHPLSGAPPIDIFRLALKGFDYRPYISSAVKRALRKFK